MGLVRIIGFGGRSLQLRDDAAYWFGKMTQAAAGNIPPIAFPPTSAYRDRKQQEVLFNEALAKYGNEKTARKHVAKPGNSTHEQGTALDLWLGFNPRSENAPAIRETTAWKWLAQNMGGFGFRFYNRDIEPWHIELDERFHETAPIEI